MCICVDDRARHSYIEAAGCLREAGILSAPCFDHVISAAQRQLSSVKFSSDKQVCVRLHLIEVDAT